MSVSSYLDVNYIADKNPPATVCSSTTEGSCLGFFQGLGIDLFRRMPLGLQRNGAFRASPEQCVYACVCTARHMQRFMHHHWRTRWSNMCGWPKVFREPRINEGALASHLIQLLGPDFALAILGQEDLRAGIKVHPAVWETGVGAFIGPSVIRGSGTYAGRAQRGEPTRGLVEMKTKICIQGTSSHQSGSA